MSESVCPETGPEGARRALEIPAVWGAGLAQRSEPERSDGERSGASPAPQTATPNGPPGAPGAGADVSPNAGQDGLVGGDAEVVQEVAAAWQDVSGDAPPPPLSGRGLRQGRGRRLVKKDEAKAQALTAEQRLLLLDTWQRSGLPAADFAALVGLSKHTLYVWKKRFDADGPGGLMDRPRGGPRGSRLPELTRRTILMLKEGNPHWGCQRISDMLLRGPALPASPAAVARVLHEAGYELEEVPTRP